MSTSLVGGDKEYDIGQVKSDLLEVGAIIKFASLVGGDDEYNFDQMKSECASLVGGYDEYDIGQVMSDTLEVGLSLSPHRSSEDTMSTTLAK